MNNQNKHKRPKYTLEFKQDAAKLVNDKGYTHQQVADNLVYLLVLLVDGCEPNKVQQRHLQPRKSF